MRRRLGSVFLGEVGNVAEVPGVARDQGMTVGQRGRGNQDVHVPGGSASLLKEAGDGAEKTRCGVVKVQDLNVLQQGYDSLLIFSGSIGPRQADVQFSQIEASGGQALPSGGQFLDLPGCPVFSGGSSAAQVDQDGCVETGHYRSLPEGR